MNQALKRVISLAFVLILVLSLTIPAFAAGTVTPMEGTATVYLDNSEGWNSTARVCIATGTKNFTIKRSSITVSGAGSTLVSFQKTFNGNMQENDWESSGEWSKSSDYAYYSYYVQLRSTKAGTAKVTYKIGSKQYILKVKVVPYVNPVKSITVTNVNNSKNFASKTKTHLYFDYNQRPVLNKSGSATVKVTPASGWKITSVWLYDETTGNRASYYFGSPAKTAAIQLGKLSASHNYSLYVDIYNPKTNFTFNLFCPIKGANAA